MSRGRAVLAWAAVVAWAGFIFFMSHQQRPPYPPGVPTTLTAKLGHLTVYFVLSLLLWVALRHAGFSPGRAATGAVLLCFLYGISDEWHQSFVPGRHPDPRDVAIDTSGAVLAMLALAAARHRRAKRAKSGTEED